tara:strand:+ start:247 stop:609 length:363 start_codon:yes stop_codon:yes gene_type:complete
MTIKIFSEGTHKQIVNNQPLIDKKYQISVNPNNKNNVYVSTSNNGIKFNKIYDTLEEFFQGFSQDYSLFDSMQKDIHQIEQFPTIFKYTPKNFKKKSNNKTKKKSKKHKSFRKPRRKSNK